jgi:hypothetical protein
MDNNKLTPWTVAKYFDDHYQYEVGRYPTEEEAQKVRYERNEKASPNESYEVRPIQNKEESK